MLKHDETIPYQSIYGDNYAHKLSYQILLHEDDKERNNYCNGGNIDEANCKSLCFDVYGYRYDYWPAPNTLGYDDTFKWTRGLDEEKMGCKCLIRDDNNTSTDQYYGCKVYKDAGNNKVFDVYKLTKCKHGTYSIPGALAFTAKIEYCNSNNPRNINGIKGCESFCIHTHGVSCKGAATFEEEGQRLGCRCYVGPTKEPEDYGCNLNGEVKAYNDLNMN